MSASYTECLDIGASLIMKNGNEASYEPCLIRKPIKTISPCKGEKELYFSLTPLPHTYLLSKVVNACHSLVNPVSLGGK